VLQSTKAVELAAWSASAGWSFAPSTPLPENETELPFAFGPATGSLTVRLAQGSAALTLRAPTGFPMDQALLILGMLPIARGTVPFRLERLPPGDYTVGAGGVMKSAAVGREPAEISF
jgi:hypothetical protein